MEFLKNIDTQIFLFLNGLHNSFFDFLIFWISSKIIWIPLYIYIIFRVIKKFKKQSVTVVIFMILAIAASDLISVHLFKNVFLRYRPCHNLYIKNIVHLVNNKCGGQYGFISSHASNFFALTTLTILLLKDKKISILMIAIAVIVSYSRIYLGVHYPSDIIVGAIVGTVIAYFMYFLINKLISINDKRNKKSGRSS